MKMKAVPDPVRFTHSSITKKWKKNKYRKKKKNRGIIISNNLPNSSSTHNHGDIVLDENLIIYEILTRLTVKSLFRFKSVCKLWNSVIQKNQNFINLHLTRSKSRNPSLFIVLPAPKDQSEHSRVFLTGDFIEGCKEERRISASIHTVKTRMSLCPNIITNPINGLICFIDTRSSTHSACLYNIATRDESPLMQPPKSISYYQFGLDPATNEHKLVAISQRNGGGNDRVCEILTVVGGKVNDNKINRWRRSDVVPPHVVTNPSVYMNGSIYWNTPKLQKGGKSWSKEHRPVFIVAFDVGSEKFRSIPVPDFILRKLYESEQLSDYRVDLLEVDGRASLQIKVSGYILKMWTFDDKKEENRTSSNRNWTEVTINLPFCCWGNYLFVHLHKVSHQIILRTYSRVNFVHELKKMEHTGKKNISLHSLDWKKGRLTEFEIREIPLWIPNQCLDSAYLFTTFTESLLRVPSFSSQSEEKLPL